MGPTTHGPGHRFGHPQTLSSISCTVAPEIFAADQVAASSTPTPSLPLPRPLRILVFSAQSAHGASRSLPGTYIPSVFLFFLFLFSYFFSFLSTIFPFLFSLLFFCCVLLFLSSFILFYFSFFSSFIPFYFSFLFFYFFFLLLIVLCFW